MPSRSEKPSPEILQLMTALDEEVNKYGVPLSVWVTFNPKQKNYYYNKLAAKKSARKYWANMTAERREKVYDQARKWRQENWEEFRAKDREYRRRNREKARASARRHYHKHHEKMIERGRRRYARDRAKKLIRQSPDAVYSMISKAVSQALPRFVRDDVISAMCLAVLDGNLLVENIGKEATAFLRAYNREYDQYKTISLDAPLAGCDGLTLLDKLADRNSTIGDASR